MKKGLALILSLIIILAACAGPAGESAEPGQAGAAPGQAAQAGQAETAEPSIPTEAAAAGSIVYPVANAPRITIARLACADIPTAGFTSYNDTPNTRLWTELTGVEVEFIEMVDNTAMNLYLAGGQLADVIHVSRHFYPGGVAAMVQDGLASDITYLLMQYAPDYWHFVHSFPLYLSNAREPDGRFYTLTGLFWEPDSVFRHWSGLVTRTEFVEELGISPPETLDEFTTFLRRSRDELGVDTPFMSDSARLTRFLNEDGAITSPFGLVNSGLFHVNGTVYHGAFRPEYRDFMEYMNMLFSEGLLDNNFAVTDEPTAQAAMMSGRSAVIATAASRIANMMNAVDDPDFTLMGLASLRQEDGGRGLFSFGDAYLSGGQAWFIPATTPRENAVAALKAINFLFTAEGRYFANFGEEGRTFTFVDGFPTFTDYMTNNPDGFPLDGLLRANAMLNFPNAFMNEMQEQRFALPEQVQAYVAWADSYHDRHMIQNRSIAPDLADEFVRLWVDLETFIRESRAQFISGAMPISEFDAYISILEAMGMNRVMEIHNYSFRMFNPDL